MIHCSIERFGFFLALSLLTERASADAPMPAKATLALPPSAASPAPAQVPTQAPSQTPSPTSGGAAQTAPANPSTAAPAPSAAPATSSPVAEPSAAPGMPSAAAATQSTEPQGLAAASTEPPPAAVQPAPQATPPLAVMPARLSPPSLGWDLNLEGAFGRYFPDRQAFGFGRVRAGVLYSSDPIFYAVGLTYEWSNLADATFGIQGEAMHIESGAWLQAGALVDTQAHPGGMLSVGWSVLGAELQYRKFDPSDWGFAAVGKLRIPITFIAKALQ